MAEDLPCIFQLPTIILQSVFSYKSFTHLISFCQMQCITTLPLLDSEENKCVCVCMWIFMYVYMRIYMYM